ncbi:MAG: S26 family signal peptidase [Eubacteriales bacterium]
MDWYDFMLLFTALTVSGLMGYMMAEQTIETKPLICNTYNEYNVTNEHTYFRNITENRTYTNNYEKYMTYYPRTERICGRNAELRKNVKGISMQPFLYDGDDYWAEDVTFAEVELGDVIVFDNGRGNVLHAVIGKYKDSLITAGYNNLIDDGEVFPDEIKYRWCFKK